MGRKKSWTEQDVLEILNLMRTLDPLSLNKPVETEETTISELGDFLEDRSPTPQEIVEQKERRKKLIEFVDKLPPRQMKIIKLRYGLEDNEPKTLEEIGNLYGVTRERVRQIEAKAMKKLRWLVTVQGKCNNMNKF